MKRRLIVPAIVALLLAAAGCGGGSTAADDGTVVVAQVSSTLFAPLYVAQAKGYFKQAGLKVQLQNVKAGQDAVPLAASGKVDAVVAGFSAGMFNALHSGLDIKIVGSMGASTGDPKASPTALEVSKKLFDSGKIKSLRDLRGRKVALSGGLGAAGGYQLAAVLRPAGLSIKDIQPVNLGFPDMEAAIANGSVDAALPPAPFTIKMERSGVAVALGVPPKGTVASGVIYGGQFVGKPSARKFFSAMVKAAADLAGPGAKSPEILGILAKATGQDLAVLKEIPSYTWSANLAPDTNQLQAQQDAYLKAGLLDYTQLIPASQYADLSFSQQK